MKNLQKIALFSAVISLAGCESHKKSTIDESGTEVVKVRTPVSDTVQEPEIPEAETRTVEGTVVQINNGKDGYTAKLEAADKQIYYVTISHSNLKDPGQYKSVNVGDKLKATGDYWKLGEEQQITVRRID